MWTSTVGLVNGKHRYLTAETFGFKVNSNGQVLKKRQQWTIEPFPENLGPDGSISSAASVSSQCNMQGQHQPLDPNDPCILTFSSGVVGSSLTSVKSSSNGSSASDQDNCGEEHENIAIKSHLNKYLAVDSFGNVTCDSEEKTENARFTITICSMSQGRSKDEHIFWAFKNVERGYYLGTTEDGMICCSAKVPKSRAELWHLHLIPARGASFFAIKSLGRKRFARVVDEESSDKSRVNSQVQLDATISWGPETLFQLKYYDGGRYALLTSNCMYLTNEGKCLYWREADELALPPQECLFTLEYHSGFLAFRDSFSHYLAAAGRSSILRSRSIGVSRDELFLFESAPIQVSLKATFNNRWVSIKQGVDLSANQMETSIKYETFQFTYHKQTQNWSIMTYDCNFWTLSQNTSTISVCKPGDYEGLNRGQFKLVWSDNDSTFSLKFIDSNRQERWIAARKSGQLFLASSVTSQTPTVKFIMRFQNRKLMNLRPVDGSGFVGLKVNSNCELLDANKTSPDSIAIEYSELPNQNPIKAKFLNQGITKTLSPRVPAKPDMNLIQEQPTINMFNVRLNSTKMGQSFLERDSITPEKITSSHDFVLDPLEKEIEFGIDANNNCVGDDMESKYSNGSVESTSTPSVASIINSFSNAKITNASGNTNGTHSSTINGQRPSVSNQIISNISNLSVSKLASSFDNGSVPSTTLQQYNHASSDVANLTTSILPASNSLSNSNDNTNTNGDQLDKAEQLAQFECCYLKVISNDKYLVVGDNDSSIICDATNKACAQSWILELRSHNSIAIRASDNHAYMQLGTNGTIFLSRCDPEEASLWEF